VLARAELTDRTPLRRRVGHPCVLLDRGDRVEVLLGDRSVTVPAWIRPALEEVRARGELTPADLPLDEQSRLVLCRRLVREGLLEIG
jgi:bifunctional lysine-specific demethylase and histidyl-hydroxylase NO66